MFKKIILSFLLFVFHVSMCIANPIPVFCMFNYGIVKNSQEWSNACKSISIINKYSSDSGGYYYDRYFSLKNNIIYEYDGNSGGYYFDKYFSLKNNIIYEYDGDSGGYYYDKYYIIKNKIIYEYDGDSGSYYYDKYYTIKTK